MTSPSKRCAIYTRKSSEEGLEQEFNSLHAQREACEAFIKSQKHEGWQMIKTAYDDGGVSGGTMERPGLQQLLADIKNHKVDIIVVYKVDRLTRSLADFVKMVELFDAQNVSFVSVTQQFNTTSSMGRLTLNVLLSFAQFEREVTGERIRDKIAASKMKGMFMGGNVPLGYEVKERKLLIKPKEAQIIRNIYKRYLELGTVRLLQKELIRQDVRSSNGKPFSWQGPIYHTLSNPIYAGKIRHKNVLYPGLHRAIIDQELWDKVQQLLEDNRNGKRRIPRKTEPSPLNGKLFDSSGERLSSIHGNIRERRYRYYVSQSLIRNKAEQSINGWRLPGQEIEQVVSNSALQLLRDEMAITNSLQEFGWPQHQIPAVLTAAKKVESNSSNLIEKFVKRVELSKDSIRLTLSLSSLLPQPTTATVTRDYPMKIKRRGIEMRLIVGNSTPKSIDPHLIKTIIRAHKWFNELLSGQVKNMEEIALREKSSRSNIARILNLAFLAPDITEKIIAGEQPIELNLEKLVKKFTLPLDWTEQNKALGIS